MSPIKGCNVTKCKGVVQTYTLTFSDITPFNQAVTLIFIGLQASPVEKKSVKLHMQFNTFLNTKKDLASSYPSKGLPPKYFRRLRT